MYSTKKYFRLYNQIKRNQKRTPLFLFPEFKSSSKIRTCYHRATAKAVVVPVTKKAAELHYITCGAQNVKYGNFEVTQKHAYCSLGFIIQFTYQLIILRFRNIIRKAHAKFQEASSIGNTQKSRELYNYVNTAKSKNWKTEKIQEIFRNSKKEKLGFQGMS